MPVPAGAPEFNPLSGGHMSRFNNLRLAYRLGIAFGALILALVAIGAIAVSNLGALNRSANELGDHDVVALDHVLGIEQRIERNAYLTAAHLYIYDGDVKAQDAVEKEMTALRNANVVDMAAARKASDDAASV